MIHEYDESEITGCLGARRIAFIGDSRVRDMFWALTKRLNYTAATEKVYLAQKHQSQTFGHADMVVDFIWDPYLNSTEMHQQLAAYKTSWDPTGENFKIRESPAILLIGGGLWQMRHLGDAYFTEYKASIDKVISHQPPSSFLRWGYVFVRRFLKLAYSDDLMVIAPVQHLHYESVSPSKKGGITPHKVNQLNAYLQAISSSNRASIALSYMGMTFTPYLGLQEDGMHIDENVVKREIDVLLNLRCNSRLSRSKKYPKDMTCCGPYPPLNWFQTILVNVSVAMLLSTMVIILFGVAAPTSST